MFDASLRRTVHARVRAVRLATRRSTGVTSIDIAKRLIDFGLHAPTVYFPLIVKEALMIEPTETETQRRSTPSSTPCDDRREAAEEPGAVRGAPHDDAGRTSRRGARRRGSWTWSGRAE